MEISNLIFRYVQDSPSSLAVRLPERAYTFHELGEISKAYATMIGKSHARKVVIIKRHCIEAYAAVLGSCLAGATFSIISPDDDHTILLEKLELLQPDLIVVDNQIYDILPAKYKQLLIKQELIPTNVFLIPDDQNNILYVSWTSGTMGTPKGVNIPASGFSHFIKWALDFLDFKPGNTWGEFSSFSYDLCIVNFFISMCAGLCFTPAISYSERLFFHRFIYKSKINYMRIVPSALSMILKGVNGKKEYLESLELIGLGGDKVHPNIIYDLFTVCPEISVLTTYGLTETTGFNSYCLFNASSFVDYLEFSYVSIGHPVPGWELSFDIDGELIISSEYLGLGYLNINSDEFSYTETIDGRSMRAFHTGDLASIINGKFYITGRKGRQIKIGGTKIHLDLLDVKLSQIIHYNCFSCFIDNEIVSFIESNDDLDIINLKSILYNMLEDKIALPSKIVLIKSMPLNINGKIDQYKLNDIYKHRSM